MNEIEQIKVDISEIKERNKKVESDKAWETSFTRKILITVLTYIVVVIFFYFANLPKPFVNAIIPALAFIVSNLSIPLFKKWWLKYI